MKPLAARSVDHLIMGHDSRKETEAVKFFFKCILFTLWAAQVPFSPIMFETRQTSHQLMSPEQSRWINSSTDGRKNDIWYFLSFYFSWMYESLQIDWSMFRSSVAQVWRHPYHWWLRAVWDVPSWPIRPFNLRLPASEVCLPAGFLCLYVHIPLISIQFPLIWETLEGGKYKKHIPV